MGPGLRRDFFPRRREPCTHRLLSDIGRGTTLLRHSHFISEELYRFSFHLSRDEEGGELQALADGVEGVLLPNRFHLLGAPVMGHPRAK